MPSLAANDRNVLVQAKILITLRMNFVLFLQSANWSFYDESRIHCACHTKRRKFGARGSSDMQENIYKSTKAILHNGKHQR